MLGMFCTEPQMQKLPPGHNLLGLSMAVQEEVEINMAFAIEHLACYAPVLKSGNGIHKSFL